MLRRRQRTAIPVASWTRRQERDIILVLEHRHGIPPPGAATTQVGVRLTLSPSSTADDVVNGGWWPRTRDPATELPALATAVAGRLGVVRRIALNADAWTFLAPPTRDHRRPEGPARLVHRRRAHDQADGRRRLAAGPPGDSPRHPRDPRPDLSVEGSLGVVPTGSSRRFRLHATRRCSCRAASPRTSLGACAIRHLTHGERSPVSGATKHPISVARFMRRPRNMNT